MTTDWYKDWFETKEYLNVYRHRNEGEAEDLVNIILNNVRLSKSGKVLDMACGTGRHSILFAKKGFKVTAVDLSKNMLSAARKKAESEKLKIDFIQSDLRFFANSGRFDLAINLFTSFGYFETDEENFEIFNTAYNHLKTDGYFVLDFFNKYFVEKNLIIESHDSVEKLDIIQKRKIDGLRVVKEIIISDNDQSRKYYESVRMFSQTELINELIRIGFAIEKTFGDFQGNKFDQFSSPRIIIIAKK
ncbi:MAG: class I SAM-dependent methyltransferase [Ignavibacteriaceae bacterium]